MKLEGKSENAEWSEWSVDTFVMCLWECYFASLLHDAQTKVFDHKRLRTFKNHIEKALQTPAPLVTCEASFAQATGELQAKEFCKVCSSIFLAPHTGHHWTHRLKRCKSWSSTKERLRRAGPRNTGSGTDVHVLWYQQHYRKHFWVHLRK